MASNKNQHFVPRCYLKSFTVGENKKTINLYNIDRQLVVDGAPIKHQCSRDYFYGNDQALEDAIQTSERAYASCLPNLLTQGNPVSNEVKNFAIRFWYLQYLRTEAASKRAVQMSEDADKVVGGEMPVFSFEIKQAVQMGMLAYAQTINYLDDLSVVLITNTTSTPFITSDDPAVLVNRWANANKPVVGSSVGVSAAGLICVLPISPKVCCYAYDKNIYSIQNKSGWAAIKREKDVDAINSLQFLNCFANVYFNDISKSNSVDRLVESNSSLRRNERHRINYAIPDVSDGEYTRYVVVDPKEAGEHQNALIHMESIGIEPKSWPSFLRWRKRGYYFSNHTGVGCVRQAHVTYSGDRPFEKIRTGH